MTVRQRWLATGVALLLCVAGTACSGGSSDSDAGENRRESEASDRSRQADDSDDESSDGGRGGDSPFDRKGDDDAAATAAPTTAPSTTSSTTSSTTPATTPATTRPVATTRPTRTTTVGPVTSRTTTSRPAPPTTAVLPVSIEESQEFLLKYRAFVTEPRPYVERQASLDSCPIGDPLESIASFFDLTDAIQEYTVRQDTSEYYGSIDCAIHDDPYSYAFHVDEFASLATREEMEEPDFLGLEGLETRLISYDERDWDGTGIRIVCWEFTDDFTQRCHAEWSMLPGEPIVFAIRIVGAEDTVDVEYLLDLIQRVGPEAVAALNFLVPG